jgi:hypothetical protein
VSNGKMSPAVGALGPGRALVSTAMSHMVEAACVGDGRVQFVAAVLTPRQSTFPGGLIVRIKRWTQAQLPQLVVAHSARGGALNPLPGSARICAFATARRHSLIHSERSSATVRAVDGLVEAHDQPYGTRGVTAARRTRGLPRSVGPAAPVSGRRRLTDPSVAGVIRR